MTNRYFTDIAHISFNHFGEELCGDHVEVIHPSEDEEIFVLADGLGSGVQASILSTLTSKMLSTMVAYNLTLQDCVNTIISTLPVIKEKGAAYCTFTIVKVKNSSEVEIYNYDNPLPFLLRDGNAININYSESTISGKVIKYAKFNIFLDDAIIMMSDGCLYAGVGDKFNFGWDMPNIMDFASKAYQPSASAMNFAMFFIEYVRTLYNYHFGDDATIGIIKIRKRQTVNFMMGPPSNKDDDDKMASLFMAKEGIHIVSGGTTSQVVARYLNESVDQSMDYVCKDIPPIGYIKGIDLVTEGVITVNRVLENAKSYVFDNNRRYDEWYYKKDGASLISKYLFEDATDINFFVGCAINEAHQKGDASLHHNVKMHLIDDLADCLRKMRKNVKVNYF